jgi:tetratricopeptide (TPR) repeat protein
MKNSANTNTQTLVRFAVTDEPTSDYYATMEPRDATSLEQAYSRSHMGDKAFEKELLRLRQKYPNNPQIGNHLIVLYKALEQYQKAEHLIEEHYKNFPDYLFARINYISLCMDRGEDDAFIKVFDGKMHLKALYPDREVFHISEFSSFIAILCRYFATQGQFEAIKHYRQVLARFDPELTAIDFLDTILANEGLYLIEASFEKEKNIKCSFSSLPRCPPGNRMAKTYH